MEKIRQKVSTVNLKKGMYVTNLDRPWLDTPFLVQGFVIKTQQDIDDLKKHCKYVVIDTEQGIKAEKYADHVERPINKESAITNDNNTKSTKQIEGLPQGDIDYPDHNTVEEELPAAKKAYSKASESIRNMLENVRSGKQLDVEELNQTVEPIFDSVIRNPDAFTWLSKLAEKDSYSYTHSVDSCALAITFGRHLSLPKDELMMLGTATLLLDVGKAQLPDELLNKTDTLSKAEISLLKKHVQFGVEIVKNTHGIDPRITEIVQTHHERHDGSGYPNKLKGTEIPVYGRMAAIIDCYDAMTSKRPYSIAISPHQVLQIFYDWRDVLFQKELLEQFIQCLGVYPTGSIVELSTGEVGIILSQNRTRSLRPKIMVIMSSDKKIYEKFKIIDLLLETATLKGDRLDIARSLEPGSYGINPSDYFLSIGKLPEFQNNA